MCSCDNDLSRKVIEKELVLMINIFNSSNDNNYIRYQSKKHVYGFNIREKIKKSIKSYESYDNNEKRYWK